MKYGVEIITKKVNKEVTEILDKQLGCHGKRDSLWSLAIDLDKIQVRPDLEGHAVELGVTPKPLKHQKSLLTCHRNVTQLLQNCHTKQLTFS